MWTISKRVCVLGLAGLAFWGLAVAPAQGQFFRQRTLGVFSPGVNPNSPFYNPLSPTFRVAPGLSSQQALFNTFQPLAAAASLPPWFYGFNPYPSPIVTTGPVIPGYGGGSWYGPGISNPYGGGGYPIVVGGYGGGGGGGGSNPYGGALVDPGNPYSSALAATAGTGSNPYSSGYSFDPYSGFLNGSANVISAFSQNMLNQERARILREMSLQAKEQTRKMRFETDKFIRDNTPTFTQEQAKIAKTTLERIRTNASPAEIESGKAVNLLLKDLARFQDKKEDITQSIDEDILKHLNITNPDGVGNLGLLRNDGQLSWPVAFLEPNLSEDERTKIDNLAKGLYELALQGSLKKNLTRDLEERVDQLEKVLQSKFNEIPSGQFLEARRFLRELQGAVVGLQSDLGPKYGKFLQFIRRGKTAKEVADYLTGNGLFIAPALVGDEPAYQAVFNALANYDIAANAQLASR
jgi:hypothetical protein